LPWSAATIEQRRFDGLRLLRQVPAITELAQLDPAGKQRLWVSRLDMDLGKATEDYSQDPKFTEALARIIHDSTSFSSPRRARAPSTSPDLIRIGV